MEALRHRPRVALLVLVSLVFLSLSGSTKASTCNMECLINQVRVAHGVRALKDSQRLDGLAELKILQDITCKQFSHYPCGVNLLSKAEVLGYGNDRYGSARAILTDWLNSVPHRQNVLGARWHFFGVATWRGRFFGNTVTFWAVEFV